MKVTEMGREVVHLVHLSQDRAQWWALVNIQYAILLFIKGDIFLGDYQFLCGYVCLLTEHFSLRNTDSDYFQGPLFETH
jgi:hypothetical protein